MNEFFLENQSWAKVKKYLEDSDTILIPIGSTENQGNHLPLGLDTHVAMYLCEKVSKKASCMIGPCLSIGYSKWFKNFPGTISFQHNTLTLLLLEYCNSLYNHGFKNFIFINPHMGNCNAIADIGREIRNKKALVTMVDIWRTFENIAQDTEIMKNISFSHGGEIMTSVALAIYPEYVDMQNTHNTNTSSPLSGSISHINTLGLSKFEGKNIWTYINADEITDTGFIGDPSNATKEKGSLLLEKMISYLEKLVKEIMHIKN